MWRPSTCHAFPPLLHLSTTAVSVRRQTERRELQPARLLCRPPVAAATASHTHMRWIRGQGSWVVLVGGSMVLCVSLPGLPVIRGYGGSRRKNEKRRRRRRGANTCVSALSYLHLLLFLFFSYPFHYYFTTSLLLCVLSSWHFTSELGP